MSGRMLRQRRAFQTRDRLDARNVVRWIMEDVGGGSAAGSSRLGKAAAIAEALVKKGLAVDRVAEMAIATAIAEADASDVKSQCRDVAVVWIIYTGQLPGDDERRLFSEKRMACMVEDKDPLIDVRLFKSYGKQHTTTTVPMLERALREQTGRIWQDYGALVGRLLRMNVVSRMHPSVRSKSAITPRRSQEETRLAKRRYLQIYFFEENMGLGLSEEKCMAAALQIASADLTQPLPQLPATVPADVKMMEEQMSKLAMLGRWPYAASSMVDMYQRGAAMLAGRPGPLNSRRTPPRARHTAITWPPTPPTKPTLTQSQNRHGTCRQIPSRHTSCSSAAGSHTRTHDTTTLLSVASPSIAGRCAATAPNTLQHSATRHSSKGHSPNLLMCAPCRSSRPPAELQLHPLRQHRPRPAQWNSLDDIYDFAMKPAHLSPAKSQISEKAKKAI